MAATTMPSIISLAAKLAHSYPQLHFAPGTACRWSPETATIYYADSAPASELLHELGHALLGHQDFTRDIRLIEMERDAWQKAAALADSYQVTITDNLIDEALDSYRDWLHARSRCPQCDATGMQTGANHYKCLACLTTWRVNDARQCALRRYKDI